MMTGVVPCPAASAPVNGSFEAGSLSGWQVDIASGQSAMRRGYRPAGTASVVSSWSDQAGLNPRSAMDGSRFVKLGTQANGNFTGQRSYHISIQQELSLTAGTQLSGWAFFFNGDNEQQDSAWVKILSETGETIAIPWRENSGCQSEQVASHPPYRNASDWTQWVWQTPESGSYTLSFGMTTADDNNYASYGFFDGVLVSPPALPVPEPTTLALAALGATVLIAQRRVVRRND
jgi:hypothetical protein